MSKNRMNSDFFEGFTTENPAYENSFTEEIAITPLKETPIPETIFDSMQTSSNTFVEVCNCQNVNVRAEASGSSKILSVVPKGFKCILLEDTVGCDFYKVRDTKTGEIGFIKKEYMKRC